MRKCERGKYCASNAEKLSSVADKYLVSVVADLRLLDSQIKKRRGLMQNYMTS